mmetsp:Transcript_29991/g.92527  ORF Transcript_29991/g.92527 Transcript_29991/m.92527 type:complete len:132 (-) Transcript_29991:463-858(-)
MQEESGAAQSIYFCVLGLNLGTKPPFGAESPATTDAAEAPPAKANFFPPLAAAGGAGDVLSPIAVGAKSGTPDSPDSDRRRGPDRPPAGPAARAATLPPPPAPTPPRVCLLVDPPATLLAATVLPLTENPD